MMLAVYQDPESVDRRRYTARELEDFARTLRDHIVDLRPLENGLPVPTEPSYVERVDLYGAQHEAIFIETDLNTWNRLGVSSVQLGAALRARNVVASGGTIDTDRERFSVQTASRFDSERDIERIVVDRVLEGTGSGKLSGLEGAIAAATSADSAGGDRSPFPLRQGVPVLLADLGLEVRRGYVDPPSQLTRFVDSDRSHECVVLAFTMKPGVNIVDLDEAVTNLLENQLTGILPPEILVAKAANQPDAVEKKVSEVTSNVISSVVIVVGVLIFLAGLRVSLIAGIAVPAIMLIAIALMRLWDVAIEQISLAALLVALGILVDNTIQVCDNIKRYLEMGKTPFEAATEAPMQIAGPLLVATGTIVAAFLPMTFLLTGETREYVFSLPVVVSLALVAGWIFAMTVTPILAHSLLKPKAQPPSPKEKDSQDRNRSLFRRLALLSVRGRWVTLSIAYGLLIAAFLLPVPDSFFPLSDRNQFIVDVYLPESAPIARTSETTAQLERTLLALNRVTYVNGAWQPVPGDLERRVTSACSFVGTGGPFVYPGLYPTAGGANYAAVWVNTQSGEQVAQLIADLRQAASTGIGQPGTDEHVPPIVGARVVPHNLVQGTPVVSPIDVRVLGPRLGSERILRRYGERVKEALRDTGLVWDVHDSWGEHGRQLDVILDEDRAALAGVTSAATLGSMNKYYSGQYVTSLREADRQIPVFLRLPQDQRSSLEILPSLYVEGLHGKLPLSSVAEIDRSWRPAKINRYQRQRNFSVRCRPEAGLLYSVVLDEVSDDLKRIAAEMPPGYRLQLGGIDEEAKKGEGMNARVLAVGGTLIFVLLVVQFNSLVKPFMIVLTLPLAAGADSSVSSRWGIHSGSWRPWGSSHCSGSS